MLFILIHIHLIFDDIYYIGEVKSVTINELKQQFPNLTQEELEELTKQGIQTSASHNRYINEDSVLDANTIQILYFNYKTYNNQVFKIKKTASGADKQYLKAINLTHLKTIDLYLLKNQGQLKLYMMAHLCLVHKNY